MRTNATGPLGRPHSSSPSDHILSRPTIAEYNVYRYVQTTDRTRSIGYTFLVNIRKSGAVTCHANVQSPTMQNLDISTGKFCFYTENWDNNIIDSSLTGITFFFSKQFYLSSNVCIFNYIQYISIIWDLNHIIFLIQTFFSIIF